MTKGVAREVCFFCGDGKYAAEFAGSFEENGEALDEVFFEGDVTDELVVVAVIGVALSFFILVDDFDSGVFRGFD